MSNLSKAVCFPSPCLQVLEPRDGMQMKAWRSEAYDRDTKKLLWVGQVTETDNFEAVSGAVVDRLKREARRGFWVFFFFF